MCRINYKILGNCSNNSLFVNFFNLIHLKYNPNIFICIFDLLLITTFCLLNILFPLTISSKNYTPPILKDLNLMNIKFFH